MPKCRVSFIPLSAAAIIAIAALVSHADFVDRFNTGQVTACNKIPDFWTVNNYSGADYGSSIDEPVGGPLKLSYTGDPSGKAGPRLCSQVSSEFDFFAHPVSLTIAAPQNSTLTPVKPPLTGNNNNDNSDPSRAWTFLGLTATSGPGMTDGPNRVVLQLSDGNVLKFTIKDSENKVLYTLGVFNVPQNARVKKMTLYLDGTDEANDNFYINFGIQYTDAGGTVVNDIRFDTPFNLGGQDNNGARKTQAQLDAVKAGFPHGAAAVIELLNVAQ